MFGRKKKQGEAAAAPSDDEAKSEAKPEKKKGWFSRLKDGLTKSKDKITQGIDAVIDEGAEEAAPEAAPAPPPVPEPAPKVAASPPEPQAEAALAPVSEPAPKVVAPPAEPEPEPKTPPPEPVKAEAPKPPPQAPQAAEPPKAPQAAEPPKPAQVAEPPKAAEAAPAPPPAKKAKTPSPAKKAPPAPPPAPPPEATRPEPAQPEPVVPVGVPERAAPAAEPVAAAPASPEPVAAKVEEPAEPQEPQQPQAPAPPAAKAEEAKPRPGLAERIVRFVRRRKLDDAALESIEEVLITADLGPAAAARLTAELARDKFDKAVSSEEVREALAANVAEILQPVALPLTLDRDKRPHVVLVVGVNGSGKTTTIGKLGKQWADDGLTVSFAAGDTFRAAAVEQLKIWGERVGASVLARDTGADAAGLAFDALKGAAERGDDVLLIDTAGRLQNKADLMAELEKIVRVLRKLDESAPHSVLLVLDATVGQNAHSQVQIFKEIAEVSGLIVTKLDGSAKGGVIVALAEKFGLPIHAIGVGEGAEDMRPFTPRDFARSLMGLEG
jgi:fused signal recognition particle receptor